MFEGWIVAFPILRAIAVLIVGALASGCALLPREGPDVAAFVDAAAAPEGRFALVDVDAATAAALARADDGAPAAFADDADGRAGRLTVGDMVAVTIFEPTAGGPFAGQSDGEGGAQTLLPPQRVDASGAVRVPFAGAVPVAGLSADDAARRIEQALAGRAVSPQVVLHVQDTPGRSVTVLGDAVAGGGRVPLLGTQERVLDVIATAGGLTRPIHETSLRLTRGAHSLRAPVADLIERPDRNVRVRPGDILTVAHEPRRFIVLGAVTQNAEVPFGRASLTLNEALAKSAGLLDERADPSGVFVVRYEDPRRLATLPRPPAAPQAADGLPRATVYRVDQSGPEGLIAAMTFPMRDGDLIYVANAEITPTQKMLGLFGQVLPFLSTALLAYQIAD